MTENEIWTGIVQWVAQTTSLTTIRAYQEGPSPAETFCVVNLVESGAKHQHPQRKVIQIVDANNSTIYDVLDWQWVFSIHCYGDGGSNQLNRIRASLEITQGQEPLFPNVVITEVSKVRLWQDSVLEKFRQRAQIDLIVCGTMRETFEADVITGTETPDIAPKP